MLNILVITSYTWYSVQIRKGDLFRQVDAELMIAASNAAFLLADEDYQAAQNGNFSKEKSDAYQIQVYKMLKNTNIKFIYTVIKQDNDIYFVLDTPLPEDLESGEMDGPLDLYEEPSDKLLRAFNEGITLFDEYQDEWGNFRSIYLPQKTANGITYIAGADIPIDTIKKELNTTIFYSIGMGFILFLISSAVIYRFISHIVAPITLAEKTIAKVSDEHNLSLRVESGNDEIGRLLHSFNSLIGKISTILQRVQAVSVSVDNASQQINRGSMDLAGRTDHSSASLHQIASSIQEITSTVTNTAQSCQSATQMANDAVTAATQGGRMIETIASSMTDIHQNSQKVSDIIGLIDSIAFQTNILALNAAVEAARAGEHGRGFAVVATEVRTLAQRSAASAQEIRQLIQTNTEQVNQQNAEVEQAVEFIQKISTQVQHIADLMQSIQHATEHQNIGIHEVNQAIHQLDEVTRQNLDFVKENSTQIQQLHIQIQTLNQLMGIFKMDTPSYPRVLPPSQQSSL